jgi:hypothetical protein
MKGKKASHSRSGQVVLLSPFLLLALAAMLALAVDVGRITQEKAQLQNACDAGALAGAGVLLRGRINGLSEERCRAKATTEAVALFRANTAEALSKVEFGHEGAGGSFVVASWTEEATLVRVTGARDGDAPGGRLPMFFAGLLGVNDARVAAVAVAQVTAGIRGVLANLGPFGIPVERVPAIGATMTFYPGDPKAYKDGLGDDKVVPGNWGLLNLNGGDLSTGELVDWIENGTGSLVIPEEADYVWIDGTSGFRAALNKPIRDRIGESMIVVVYDQVVGTGSTAQFRCIGFIDVTITGCKLVGKDPYAECRVNQVVSLHELVTGGWTSPNVRKVQLIS